MGLKLRARTSASRPIGLRHEFLVALAGLMAFSSAALVLPQSPPTLCFYCSTS